MFRRFRLGIFLSTATIALFGCPHANTSAQLSQTTPQNNTCTEPQRYVTIAVHPPLEPFEGWAGISMHFSQSYAGFDRQQQNFAHCYLHEGSTCEVLSSQGSRLLRGTATDVDGSRDESLFSQLRALGYNTDPMPPSTWPHADVRITTEVDTISEGNLTRRMRVSLQDTQTQTTVALAEFRGQEPLRIRDLVYARTTGLLGLVADDLGVPSARRIAIDTLVQGLYERACTEARTRTLPNAEALCARRCTRR